MAMMDRQDLVIESDDVSSMINDPARLVCVDLDHQFFPFISIAPWDWPVFSYSPS